MGRLAMLHAITDEELFTLRTQKKENMYNYICDIERKYNSSFYECALNKAWEGIHWCVNNGKWIENDAVPANIIFGGVFLLDSNYHVIILKDHNMLKEIVEYLQSHDLKCMIQENFYKIREDEYSLPIDENGLDFLLDWSKGILDFYENALKNSRNVIFSVIL